MNKKSKKSNNPLPPRQHNKKKIKIYDNTNNPPPQKHNTKNQGENHIFVPTFLASKKHTHTQPSIKNQAQMKFINMDQKHRKIETKVRIA